MTSWNARTARRARMLSLQLDRDTFDTPALAVEWFGAMQAQDLSSALWSFGLRSDGLSRSQLQDSYARSELVRTWAMRGTLHFVLPEDAIWMSSLTGTRTLPAYSKSLEAAGVDAFALARARELVSTALPCERSGFLALLEAEGVPVAAPAGYLLLCVLSMEGLIGLGLDSDGQATVVSLDSFSARSLNFDQSLVELTWRYFRSHGPASVKDFANWSGLTMQTARQGLEANSARLAKVNVEGTPMYASIDLVEMLAFFGPLKPSTPRALPGFDEFLLGFKDRSMVLAPEHAQRVVPGNNGVFKPTLMVDGLTAGVWNVKNRSGALHVEATTFNPISQRARRSLVAQFNRYGKFLELPVDLTWRGL